MKKFLLPVIALITTTVQAQYTPAGTSLPNGTSGTAYSQTITVAVPATGSVSGSALTGILTAAFPAAAAIIPLLGALPAVPLAISTSTLTVAGLPPGITSTCTPAGCSFTGGGSGSIALGSTPTSGGTYSVAITSSTLGTLDLSVLPATLTAIVGSSLPLPQAIPGVLDKTYTLVISGPSGIEDLDLHNFSAIPAYPSPSAGDVNFAISSPTGNDVRINIIDLNGRMIHTSVHTTQAGANLVALQLNIASGVYGYTLSQNDSVVRGKLTIAK